MRILNGIVMRIPSNSIRLFLLTRVFKLKAGKGVIIAPKVKIISPWYITIGNNTIINSSVLLDGRGKLFIGNNVDIAWFTKIITYKHDYQSPFYTASGVPIFIGNDCCIAVNAILLPGANIPDGCVIGASSVVTNVLKEKNSIYVGSPARFIKSRDCKIDYILKNRSVTI
jgi:acetyltransferase-like isoleucine patch superfamily enzyme